MKKITFQFLIIVAFLVPINLHAQDGSLDTTFHIGSWVDSLNHISTTTIQTDGKIIISGEYNKGLAKFFIARLNLDGSLDSSFNAGTGPDSNITTVSIQSDGKIIIGGYFNNFNDTARNRIARLNEDGSLDLTFNFGVGLSFDGHIKTTAIQSDGKIIIGGDFTSYNGILMRNIARLDKNGSVDFTFMVQNGFKSLSSTSSVNAIVIDNNGKIVVGGSFSSYNDTSRSFITRLNTNGSLDNSFDAGLNVTGIVNTISIQNDGKIILGGFKIAGNNGAVRLNTNGSLDNSFLGSWTDFLNIYASVIQDDEKILFGSDFFMRFIIRLNKNGSFDPNLNVGY
jgi:uncharacterized delta-60 repeat protein